MHCCMVWEPYSYRKENPLFYTYKHLTRNWNYTQLPTTLQHLPKLNATMTIMKAITHWRPYLIWTEKPFTIYTDHANLLYWKSSHKLNCRTACWHSELQDDVFTLEHVSGKTHTAADTLSRPPGSDEGKQDNQQIMILPKATFIQIADANSDESLENMITDC